MCPNVSNAHRTQSECLKCTSIVEECTMNFHSDGIPVHSDSRVPRVLIKNILLFYGQHFDFSVLYINVLKYRYFYTNCSTFLKIKNVAKIKKTLRFL